MSNYFTRGVTNSTGAYNLLVTDLSNNGSGMYFGGTFDETTKTMTGENASFAADTSGFTVKSKKVTIGDGINSLTLTDTIKASQLKKTGNAGDKDNVLVTVDQNGTLVRNWQLFNQYNTFNDSISGRMGIAEDKIVTLRSDLSKTDATALDLSKNYYAYKSDNNLYRESLSGRIGVIDLSRANFAQRIEDLEGADVTTNAAIEGMKRQLSVLTPYGETTMADILSQHAQAINDLATVMNDLNFSKPLNPSADISNVGNNHKTIPLRGLDQSNKPVAVWDYLNYVVLPPTTYNPIDVQLTQDSLGFVYIIHPDISGLNLVAPSTTTTGKYIDNGTLALTAKVGGLQESANENIVAATNQFKSDNDDNFVCLYRSPITYTSKSGDFNYEITVDTTLVQLPYTYNLALNPLISNTDRSGINFVSVPTYNADSCTPFNGYDIYKSTSPVSATADRTTLYYQAFTSASGSEYITQYRSPVSINLTSMLREMSSLTTLAMPATGKKWYVALSEVAMKKWIIVTGNVILQSGGVAKTTTIKLQGQSYGEYAPYGISQSGYTLSQFENKFIPDIIELNMEGLSANPQITINLAYQSLDTSQFRTGSMITVPSIVMNFVNGAYTSSVANWPESIRLSIMQF